MKGVQPHGQATGVAPTNPGEVNSPQATGSTQIRRQDDALNALRRSRSPSPQPSLLRKRLGPASPSHPLPTGSSTVPLEGLQDDGNISAARPPGMSETHFGKMPQGATIDPKQAARDELKAHLDDPIRFQFAQGVDLEQQRALQNRYLDWAAEVHAARRKALGDDYRIGGDMSPRYAEGYLNAIFEALCGGISSAMRSPYRNAVVTALAPQPSSDPNAPPSRPLGELAFAVDAMAIGGAIGGTGSFFAEKILLPALAEEAARHNLPQMKAVDKEVLAASPATGVPRLVVRGGPQGPRVKQFYVPATTDEPAQGRDRLGTVPTAGETREDSERGQWWIEFKQKFLDEQNLGGLLGNPVVTGLYNAGRRLAMSSQALTTAGPVLGASMLASGAAGATTKLVLNAMKVTPYVGQTSVDDLLGGQQRLNAYVPASRGGGEEMATWGDIQGVLSAAGHATATAAELFTEAFRREPTLLGMDWFFRHVLPNVAVSIAAPGYGGFLAQAARRGSFDPLPGEGPHSLANVFQQFGQSFFNDLAWKVLQILMSHFKADLAGNRKVRLAIETERLQDDRADGVERVTGASNQWSEVLTRRSESGQATRVDEAALRAGIELDTPENVAQSVTRVRAAHDALEAGPAPDPLVIATLRGMLTELERLVGIDEELARKKDG